MIHPVDEIPAKPEGEISSCGAPLRIPAHGAGRLQIGNPKATGRPKKAIREEALKGASVAVDDDLRILRESTDPVLRERAKDRLMRYGLGTSDEVQMVNADQVLSEFAKVAASLGIDKETAALIVQRGLESLGVSK